MTHRPLTAAALLVALVACAHAQDRVTGANYPLAQKFNREFISQHVQEARVAPQWIGKTDVFWYSARNANGTKFWKVDPAKKERTPLFDHVALASQLSELSKKPLEAESLRVANGTVSADGKKFTFDYSDYRYEFDLAASKLKQTGKTPSQGGPMSPEAIERMRQQFGEERVNEMLRQLGNRGRRQEDEQQEQQQQEQQQQQQGGGTGGTGQPPAGGPSTSYKNVSPDKKLYAYVYKYNLYLCEEGQPEEKATQLTKDGAEEYSFGGGGFGGRGFGGGGTGTQGTGTAAGASERKTRANVTWSTDSKAFYITRTDSRGVKDLFLVNSIANPRPTLEQYKYPMPGEENVRKQELFYCDVAKKALTKVEPKWKDERYMDLRWGKAAGELRFMRRDRLQRNLEICAFDVFTGKCDCLLTEGFEAANLALRPAGGGGGGGGPGGGGNPRYLEDTDEMIWWSERSGWGHYYLYSRDGKLKNAITSGAWRAGGIVEVDAKNKLIYLTGNAREPGENVYFTHLYRVKFDGTGLTCLDPGNFNQSSSLSPTKKFVVVNSTKTDHAPFAVVNDDSGKEVMKLEQTDLAALEKAGWKMPETFVVKAADGVTDLFGNMWKPFDFNASKKYPIIVYVYPGPQTEGVDHRFAAYTSYQQLAQLGFVVIQVGHRGGSPMRSKAYGSFGYFNLRDYGLVDKKAAIEALAARHAYIDLDRVGIYGHSGGGFMSAAALLQKPYNEFFKAAVASAGNHDNNIYNDNWSEQWHGLKLVSADAATTTGTGATRGTGVGAGTGQRRRPPAEEIELELIDILESYNPDDEQSVAELEKRAAELKAKIADLKKAETATAATATASAGGAASGAAGAASALAKLKFEIKVPTNAELADNLKGHLMLVHGEIDNNVHPANTMRLVDALIKANKRFDLLIIPGARHGFGVAQPYFTQRMWDFFAEHLLSDRQTGADIVLGNTYHLMLRPGAERVARLGGLQRFMNWNRPVLTDSGGFQVMSLASLRKLDESGVRFRSHIDGAHVELTPERSIEIQHLLNANITMVLDECTAFPATADEARASMELSMRWAERSKRAFQPRPGFGLFGIVQGSVYADLRAESAAALAATGFDGYAVGGLAIGEPQAVMFEVLDATVPALPADRPHYLMGVGLPEDILEAIERGMDIEPFVAVLRQHGPETRRDRDTPLGVQPVGEVRDEAVRQRRLPACSPLIRPAPEAARMRRPVEAGKALASTRIRAAHGP